MRIGELARRTGASVRALRYYEQQGLLWPERSGNGYRRFHESDVERVAQIRLLFSAGLPSSKIVEVLPCICGSGLDEYETPEPQLVENLLSDRARIVGQIEDLTATLAVLDRVIDAARGPDAQDATPARHLHPGDTSHPGLA